MRPVIQNEAPDNPVLILTPHVSQMSAPDWSPGDARILCFAPILFETITDDMKSHESQFDRFRVCQF